METAARMGERSGGNGTNPGGRRPVQPAQVPPGRSVVAPVPPDRYRYSIAELEEQTGFSSRTIRYYVSKALLPPAHGRGPTATYDLSHLLRLRAIQRRRAEGVTLEEIKNQLDDMSDEDIAAVLQVRTDPMEDRWRRITLHDDIELHVRERGGQPPDAAFAATVEQIVDLARVVVDTLDRTR